MSPTSAMLTLTLPAHHSQPPSSISTRQESSSPYYGRMLSLFSGDWKLVSFRSGYEKENAAASSGGRTTPAPSVSAGASLGRRFEEAMELSCWSC
ncbi:hypothetical protein SAY87_031468 [Trapa incisa]|uniref:Uncharacterized protein n=1 Tax=Trapa incisa TaxID=236973 RepID=A0AAN7KPF1_9MYRT|nr:hypothetical protein SAY87_031468 [Trapa incisa]